MARKNSINYKDKKSINVSIQSKKVHNTIVEILEKWDKKGVVASNIICENIILGTKIEKSATLIKVVKTFEMVENILSLRYERESLEYEVALEQTLNNIIKIDVSNLDSLFINQPKVNIKDDSNKIKNKIEHKEEIEITPNEEVKNNLSELKDDSIPNSFNDETLSNMLCYS